jgi:hypothetical protein
MKLFGNIRFSVLVLVPAIMSMSLISKSDRGDPRIEKIIQQIDKFKAQYQQQKVYVHTDKDIYQTGEMIWLKTYLMDALSLQADSVSKEIFVELLDQNRRVAASLIIANKKGYSEGNIMVSDTLIEGNYQLRAYTNWMNNFDRDYFFFKTIRIKNPNYDRVVTKSRLKIISDFNSEIRKKQNENNLSFFPEGGNLVAGVQSRIAFKAETGVGSPLDIKGTVVDNKGTTVVSFESAHDGMGCFNFIPQPDVRYSAKVTFSNGKVKEFSLPQTSPKGIVMSVDPFGEENIKVVIRPNGIVTNNNIPSSIVIVAQSRGQIIYISKGEINDKPVMSTISKKLLPAGITQITIFDSKGEPVCERLVFIKPEVEKNISKVDLTSTLLNDSIICNIKVTPTKANFSSGNLSLSVVENQSNIGAGNENILTNLLLTSDIKGRVINPSYYFDTNNPNAPIYLDLIMMTNGWRRFVWKDLLADKFPTTSYSRAGGISISGHVYGENLTNPITNTKVMMEVLKKFDFKFEATTDINGRFEFPALDYQDTVDVKIEAVKTSDGKPGYIALSESPLTNNNTSPLPLIYNEQYNKEQLKENTKKDDIEKKKHPKIKSKQDEEAPVSIYGTPSSVVKIGNDASNYSSIMQYLQGKLPGFDIKDGMVVARGANTIYLTMEPLIYFNSTPINVKQLSTMSALDIDRVEILEGHDASIYGASGANGVLFFYSKHGNFKKLSSIELKMIGYQKAREFYIPPYESWTSKPQNNGVPKTLYWKPNISLNSQGEAVVRFKKNFSSDKLNITLEGLTSAGEIVYKNIQN